ncbi:MAG TPA: hypothetical protein VE959_03695, partial [Bryobacteraceae bacterium]|nr:hypothetical protein [Bryobacteraceae bacterium]
YCEDRGAGLHPPGKSVSNEKRILLSDCQRTPLPQTARLAGICTDIGSVMGVGAWKTVPESPTIRPQSPRHVLILMAVQGKASLLTPPVSRSRLPREKTLTSSIRFMRTYPKTANLASATGIVQTDMILKAS